MTELREKLNNIVEEKNTKITPENLRQGAEAFGVQGTFTSDATATAGDILKDKTAYVNGEKINGIFEPLDTSDATATAEDITEGKTAYINGEKVFGTLESRENLINQIDELEQTNAGLRNEVSLLQSYSQTVDGNPVEINDCLQSICEVSIFGQTEQEENPTYTTPKTVQNVGTNGYIKIKVDNGLDENDINYKFYTRELPVQEEMCKIGNKEDYFERVDGVWYEVHNHSKYELTGGFTVAKGSIFLLTDTIMDNLLGDSDYGFCSHFFVDVNWYVNYGGWQGLGNNVMICGRSTFHQILVRCDGYTTADAFNAMLAEQKPKLYYPSINTRKLLCTAEQTEILNSFYTFDEKTRITIDGLGTMKVKYKKLREDGGTDAVLGSYVDTRGATATAEDIAEGKTAYVNGEKVTGTASQTSDKNAMIADTFTTTDNEALKRHIIELPDTIYISSNSCIQLFYVCNKLKKSPKIITQDGGKITDFYRMYYMCYELTEVPDFDMSSGRTNQMFYSCENLENLDLFTISDTIGGVATDMFKGCGKLKQFTSRALIKITGNSISGIFNGCVSLTDIPAIDVSNATTITTFVSSCNSLTNFGGLINAGKAYTKASANNSSYTIYFNSTPNITHESLMNLINGLYDLNLTYNVAGGGTLYTQKLILGDVNIAKLTAEEIAIATNKRLDSIIKGGK